METTNTENEKIKVDLLLIGSSSMDFWHTYSIDLPEYRVVNTGKGGTKSFDWLEKYDEKVLPFLADKVVCYLGGNDIIKNKTPAETAENMEKLFCRIRDDMPGVKLYYILVNPASRYRDENDNLTDDGVNMAIFNRTMEKVCRKHEDFIKIIDMRRRLEHSNGRIRSELYRPDGMHLNLSGYKIWSEEIRKAIAD